MTILIVGVAVVMAILAIISFCGLTKSNSDDEMHRVAVQKIPKELRGR